MTQIKAIFDEYGVIHDASKNLPKNLWNSLILALAELEDNECHRTRTFPITRLHRVEGVREAVYRADIDKISGWRIHIQYVDGALHLKDIVSGDEHDRVIDVIKSKRGRYEL